MRDRFTAVFAATGVVTLLAGFIVMGTTSNAQADDPECVPKVATTLTEWSVDTPGDGFEKTGETRFVETTAAVAPVPAVAEESHLEHEYLMEKVTQEYQPAVYETEYKFVQRGGQAVHWSTDPNWNAQSVAASSGFERVEGATRNGSLISPEIPEVSTTVKNWFLADPGSPWMVSGETKTVVTRAYVAAVPGTPAEGHTEFKWSKVVDAVTCDKSDNSDAKWVFVCKYVGTPGVDERLQPSENNPISVSVKSLTERDGSVAIGDEFSDGQGRSVVIAFDPSKGDGQRDEPSIDDCPAPAGPSEPPTPAKPDSSSTTSARSSVDCVTRKVTTVTTTRNVDWVLEGTTWVEKVTTSSDSSSRDATPGELNQADCPRPNQPSSIVVADAAMTVNCDLDTVTTTVTTTTTDYVYVEGTREWVKGQPVVTVEKTDKRATDEECPPEVLPAEGEDVCPNIEGVQESVPDGMEKKRGDCVEPAAGEQPKPDQPNKPGPPVIGPDEVLGTEAAQPNAVPTAVDAGIGGGMAVASSSPSNLLGQGLVGGGLMLLILAGALQSGRIGRGAHQF